MTARQPGAPMPAELRQRLGTHPARSIPCPHCKAPVNAPCATPTGRRLANPHPGRLDAYNAQEGATP